MSEKRCLAPVGIPGSETETTGSVLSCHCLSVCLSVWTRSTPAYVLRPRPQAGVVAKAVDKRVNVAKSTQAEALRLSLSLSLSSSSFGLEELVRLPGPWGPPTFWGFRGELHVPQHVPRGAWTVLSLSLSLSLLRSKAPNTAPVWSTFVWTRRGSRMPPKSPGLRPDTRTCRVTQQPFNLLCCMMNRWTSVLGHTKNTNQD